jgi:signal transduction histidine kinase
MNLIVNALDAMNDINDRPHVLHVRTGRNGADGLLVELRDSGAGLRPEQMERLFDAFYSTKTDGMGMGLSISRSIMEAHGGRLWAESHAGPGATFKFTLPLTTTG